jgi:hypothetical protein
MSHVQAVSNWVTAHLQALLFVVKAHWHALVEHAGPWLQAVGHGAHRYLQVAIDWARPSMHAAFDWLRPHLAVAAAFFVAIVAAYWVEIVVIAAAAGIAVAVAAWSRRRRRIKATLVDITLDRDPKTDWLRLGIVVGNFQSHALVVHSLRVVQPVDVRICEHWKAWQPYGAGVKFVAPELELTNVAEIERTIPPHGAKSDYPALAGLRPEGYGNGDQLKRIFYLQAPTIPATKPLRLRAVLRCELQTRKGRKQDHLLRRLLEPSPAVQVKAGALAT